MTRKFLYAIVMSLVIASWLTGCIIIPVIDDEPDDSDVIGEITIHQTGGFAGFSRIAKIAEIGGLVMLSYEDLNGNQREEVAVDPEDVLKLWETLEENDVFALPANHEMLETVMDAFFFEITVQRGDKSNNFSVYAPDLLFQETGEERYGIISSAIWDFANLRLEDATEFIVDDFPVNDILFQILESFPMQVHVVVEGYLRDGCTVVNETTQRRDGNTVYVHITTKRPKDEMCIQMITETKLRVPLDGAFFPGRYKIIVNDVEKDLILEGAGFQEEPSILSGKVTIGPFCPVEPCDIPPETIAEIYMARKIIIYDKATERKVTEVNLTDNGKYSLILDPGIYIVDVSDAEGNALPLDPAERPLVGNAIPQTVEIHPGEMVNLDINIDTGIR